MTYNEITEAQRKRIVRAATRALKRAIRAEGRKVHIDIDKVIQTLNRYKVRGRVYVEGDAGFFSEAHHPWFHVMLEGDPDGPLSILEVYINTPQAAMQID